MKTLFAVLFLFFITFPLQAHDLFLRPHPFVLDRAGDTKLSMWLAAAFPGKEEPWRADKTVQLVINGPEGKRKVEDKPKVNPIISFSTPGTYVIGWVASPSYIKIDAPTFNQYLEAEGFSRALEMRKQKGEENKEGTEKYVRYLKTLVQVGSETTDDYKQPLGFKIELIPGSNPYSHKVGAPMEFQLLLDGKPLSGATVMATYDRFSKEHDVYAHTVKSGADGKVSINIDHPGLWMVRVNYMEPLAGDPEAEWQSFWANLSFEISGR